MKHKLFYTFGIIVLAILAFTVSPTNADTVVLSDNFESVAGGFYNFAFDTNFFVAEGGVTVFVGSDCATAGGGATDHCVLLGATGSGDKLESNLVFPAGTYKLSFDLATDEVIDPATFVSFGSLVNFAVNSSPAFTLVTLTATVGAAGSPLSFFDAPANRNLLDNVTLTKVEVPEPSSLLLLVTGLAAFGGAFHWRRKYGD